LPEKILVVERERLQINLLLLLYAAETKLKAEWEGMAVDSVVISQPALTMVILI